MRYKGSMKIILIGPFPPFRGGISMFNHSLAKELEKDNQVYRISFSKQYPNLFFPGKTQFFDFNGKSSMNLINSVNPLSWKSTANYINNIEPDLVIFQYWMPFFAPCSLTARRSFAAKPLSLSSALRFPMACFSQALRSLTRLFIRD